ncbi:hypothetical protein [Singulisphaera sp. GP187]|uniref:hypothetical protein n=1 Tax=Singulisphaera sp. GP187 TaxID=1882752 RepID=UPI0011613992|nr:hypothetical protein [Singulisphaera sp. GP187]
MESLLESFKPRQVDLEQRWGELQEEILQTWMRSRRRGEHHAGKGANVAKAAALGSILDDTDCHFRDPGGK